MMTHAKKSALAGVCLLTLLSACSSLTKIMPDNGDPAAVAQAQSLRKDGNAQQALEVLRGADSQHPGNPQILQQLGYALIETEQPEEAVKVFDQLISLQPDKAVGYTGKAVAFDHAGNHLAAQDIYERALAIEPDSLPAKNNLAMSLILNNQPAQAIALLQPLVDAGTDTDTVRRNLALAYGVKGEPGKALEIDRKDMSESEAQANLKTYSEFAKAHNLSKVSATSQIGFKTAPEDKQKKKAVKKPAPIVEDKDDAEDSANDADGVFLGKPAIYEYPSK